MAVMDAYIRVSRVGARRGDAYGSPETQRDAVRGWLEREGMRRGVEVVEEDVPGSRPVAERGLERLVLRAERGESDGIAVYRVDRLGRDLTEVVLAAKRLRDAGARLVAVADGYDSAAPMGQVVLGLFAGLAEWHLDSIRQNWSAATGRAVARGVHIACRAPVGYLRADHAGGAGRDGRLVPDPESADAVRAAFELRAGGHSYREVADHLRQELGRGIAKSTVAALLQNRAYLGEARGPNGAVSEGAHDPLVTPALFEAVQMRLRAGGRPQRRETISAGARLAGLIACASCGFRLRVVGGPRPSYACDGHSAAGDCGAPSAASIPLVDEYVAQQLAGSWAEVSESVQSADRARLEASEAVRGAEEALDLWVEDPAIGAGLDRDRFARGLAARQQALDEARQRLFDFGGDGTDSAAVVWLDGRPWEYSRWGEDVEADRATLRRAIASVTLAKADPARRRWQPVGERLSITWRGQETR